MTVPVIRFHPEQAQAAFQAHAAMMIAEKANPSLAENEYWCALKDTARARFLAAFQRV
jgi:hypothetical protein